MKQIQVSEAWDLHKYAEKTYALGEQASTQEVDSTVGHLVWCWDDLCKSLEEHGRQAAKRRETVSVKVLDQAGAVGMVKAALNEINSARILHRWEYRGDLPNEREPLESDVNVEGLSTLKRIFNEFLDQERRHRRV